jgi:hypothetical protein
LLAVVGVLVLTAPRYTVAQSRTDSSKRILPWIGGSLVVGSSGAEQSNDRALGAEASAGIATRTGWGLAFRILQSQNRILELERPSWRVRTIAGSLTYRLPQLPILHFRGGLGATTAMDGRFGDQLNTTSFEAGAELDTHPRGLTGLRLYVLSLVPVRETRLSHTNMNITPIQPSVIGNLRQLYLGAGILLH